MYCSSCFEALFLAIGFPRSFFFEVMNGFSAASSIKFCNFISAYSDGTSMDYPEAIVDDDEFMSSDEMSIDVEIKTLPTELRSLIFEFQYKSRVKVRRATGCERCARSPCICRKRNRAWQNRVIEARRISQQNLANRIASRALQ